MKRWVHAVGIAAILGLVPAGMSAQWPAHVPSNVPKTADGKPNMDALAPRTADGKPDLSGLWRNGGGVAGGGQRGRGAAPPPKVPLTALGNLNFRDIGNSFENGLPFRPWAKELRDKRNAANSKDNPDALCLPMGFMQFHAHPQPRKIIQTPGLIVIMYEANYGLRQIFIDGRPLPANDPNPFWYGYSIGKWDGDTLIVESTGFRDDGWLDIIGSPYTDQLKLTEKFRRPTFGTLEMEITVDDSKAYTQPWTIKATQTLMPDGELIEFICNENQQFVRYLSNQK